MFKKSEIPVAEKDAIELLEENIQLKKIVHSQEDKLKRLGTKLIKVLNGQNREHGPKALELLNTDEMLLKIKDLERENFSLKDKNIVLRQQLENHSKQIQSIHRSPIRISHSSPRPRRYSHMEQQYISSDLQLKSETPVHDNEVATSRPMLENENQTLRNRISSLEEEIKRNLLNAQKKQLDENIELCSLMRKCKQQELLIKSYAEKEKCLDGEIKRLKTNMEDVQNELVLKEKKVLELQCKLENFKFVPLELREFEEKVRDLQIERDNLKDRCTLLLKTINEKTAEFDNLLGLKKIVEGKYDKKLNIAKTSSAQTQTLPPSTVSMSTQTETEIVVSKYDNQLSPNRMRLRNEVDLLKNMLKAQTQRCDILQNEVNNLSRGIKMKELQLKDLSNQRDLFYKILEKANVNFNQDGALEAKLMVSRPPSGSDHDSCKSGATYTKNCGTYTKTSPINSRADSPVNNITPLEVNVIVKESNSEPVESIENRDENESWDKNNILHPSSAPMTPVARPRTIVGRKNSAVKLEVTILWLKLYENGWIFQNSDVKYLYIDFSIFGESSDDFETPNAQPKPLNASHAITFNFTSDVLINNLQSRIQNMSFENAIVFNIVSEPQNDEEEVECTTVGISQLTVSDLCEMQDSCEKILPVKDIRSDADVCGQLAVQLSGLDNVRLSLNKS